MEHDLVFLLEADSSGGEVMHFDELPVGAVTTGEFRTIDGAAPGELDGAASGESARLPLRIPVYAVANEP